MILQVLGYIIGGSGDRNPWTHYAGETTSYAGADYRSRYFQSRHLGNQKSGQGIGSAGWNASAQAAGQPGRSSAGGKVSRNDYWLGGMSQEFYDKYSKWGEQGPRGNEGWKNTLTKAPPSQSTTAPTQKFNQEVFQTRETRNASGTQQFQMLKQHPNTPRLNPNLAYMYKAKNAQLGAVRRTVTRFL